MQTANSDRDPVLERFFDRAVGQIFVPQRDAQRTRRLRVAPLLGSAAAIAVVLIGALVVGRVLNEARGGVATQPSASASTTQTTIERQPATLAQLEWEAAVNEAFRAGGLQVRTIGGSVAESALGRVLPARSFIVRAGPVAGGFGIGADVIFVKGAGLGTITVCASPGSAPGRITYITSVNGQRVLSEDAVAPEYHLVSADYFVIAYDMATRDALQRGLALVPPSC